MVLKAFENILKNPAKMAYYEKNPVRKATFMALYQYKKAGHNFSELGWFTPAVEMRLKKVA